MELNTKKIHYKFYFKMDIIKNLTNFMSDVLKTVEYQKSYYHYPKYIHIF